MPAATLHIQGVAKPLAKHPVRSFPGVGTQQTDEVPSRRGEDGGWRFRSASLSGLPSSRRNLARLVHTYVEGERYILFWEEGPKLFQKLLEALHHGSFDKGSEALREGWAETRDSWKKPFEKPFSKGFDALSDALRFLLTLLHSL